jgi:putative PIN family toxin of toxin-antitoxin system
MLWRNKKTKIILDTNLWISFLISGEQRKLDLLFSREKISLLFSKRLYAEFIGVASREKFRRYFSENDIYELSIRIKKVAKIVNVKTIQTQCRDPKDNFLLELAIDGKADYLITGDHDLLTLKKIGKTQIIKIQDFFDRINIL